MVKVVQGGAPGAQLVPSGAPYLLEQSALLQPCLKHGADVNNCNLLETKRGVRVAKSKPVSPQGILSSGSAASVQRQMQKLAARPPHATSQGGLFDRWSLGGDADLQLRNAELGPVAAGVLFCEVLQRWCVRCFYMRAYSAAHTMQTFSLCPASMQHRACRCLPCPTQMLHFLLCLAAVRQRRCPAGPAGQWAATGRRSLAAAASAGPDELVITRPDDWHLHVRDGAGLASVVPHTAATYGRAIIMPNLVPPVTSAAAAAAYRERVLAAVPSSLSHTFTPLMTCYLTDNTQPEEVHRAKEVRCRRWWGAPRRAQSERGVAARVLQERRIRLCLYAFKGHEQQVHRQRHEWWHQPGRHFSRAMSAPH